MIDVKSFDRANDEDLGVSKYLLISKNDYKIINKENIKEVIKMCNKKEDEKQYVLVEAGMFGVCGVPELTETEVETKEDKKKTK